jgi:Fe-S cluster assembly ATP-binding protein
MWNPKYKITKWDIVVDWNSIKTLSADQRSKKWIFLAFQNIPEIPWIKLFDFLKSVYDAHLDQKEKKTTFLSFKKIIEPLLNELNISKDFLFRDLNVWFSWWEKRKIEILQLKLIKPKYIILDEIDSWLDINSIKALWDMLKSIDDKTNSIIIISHYFDILDYININKIFILEQWKIKTEWDKKIINKLKKQWF